MTEDTVTCPECGCNKAWFMYTIECGRYPPLTGKEEKVYRCYCGVRISTVDGEIVDVW